METSFEALLRKASSDPIFRVEFYEKLLLEPLIILTATSTSSPVIPEQNVNFEVMSFEDGRIPIFTSESKIFDKGVIQKEVPFLKARGRDIFQSVNERTFLLNPYSDYGKELHPGEIKKLLMDSSQYSKFEMASGSEFILGQPAKYPIEIVNLLKSIFINLSAVKAGYLCLVGFSSKNPPNLLVALDVDGDLGNVMNVITTVDMGQVIDFIQIRPGEKISDYLLKETTPFYIKS